MAALSVHPSPRLELHQCADRLPVTVLGRPMLLPVLLPLWRRADLWQSQRICPLYLRLCRAPAAVNGMLSPVDFERQQKLRHEDV
jgi:hypothetical protein